MCGHQRERERQKIRANDFRRKCVPERPLPVTFRHEVSSPPPQQNILFPARLCTSKEREREREPCGEPPLAGVDLRPDHAHDLLLHLGLLRVNVGVSHLAVLVPAQTGAAHQPTLSSFSHRIIRGGNQWGHSGVNPLSLCVPSLVLQSLTNVFTSSKALFETLGKTCWKALNYNWLELILPDHSHIKQSWGFFLTSFNQGVMHPNY